MLTDSEKSVILSDWNEVMQNSKELGIDIFVTLFTMYPQHKELFRDFRGKTLEELEAMPRLKAHAMRVVKTLDGSIQSLDDMEVCASSLELIGSSHKGRGVDASHFEDLNKVLLVVIGRRLGERFLEHQAVWEKLLNGIIPVIKSGM